MDQLNLSLEKRDVTGKKIKKLRKQGLLPLVICESNNASINAQANSIDFNKLFTKAGHSTLVNMNYKGITFKGLIQEVQYDPRKRTLIHAMLNKVNLKEEMTAEVPIELTGESDAVKIEKGILVTPKDSVEIKCLPADLPSKLDIDISSFLKTIGESILVKDLTLPKGVLLVHQEDENEIIATVVAPKIEEEPVPAEIPAEEAASEEGITVELSQKKGKAEEKESE